MENKIILKSDSFYYPTKDERKEIKEFIPKINQLKVGLKSATFEILNGSGFDNSIRDEDIYWWNNCLNNRIGKLIETYIYLLTHYRRLQKDTFQEPQNKHTDKILLDYYIEIFYYFFFSTRDVLEQFLNVFYNLKIEERDIYLNTKFVEKFESKKIQDLLSEFLNNTKDSYNIRNSFNHRFTPTQKDFRAKKNILKEDNKISISFAKEIKIETFIKDIENLMDNFVCLMNRLSEEIK